ncbi:MAG: hypothetical protein LBO72_04245 [Helicobacteraceae bacterium]|jgi:hypothetical protein|nr:hypothetical protein [Helicobacteraceae bacterium]
MKTTGYYLDGELAESVPFLVENLCLGNMQCFESAFKSANLDARNIIMEELKYQIDGGYEHTEELIACKNKIITLNKSLK